MIEKISDCIIPATLEGGIINNVKIYDLKSSLIASGYPMKTDVATEPFREITEKDVSRGINLNNATKGEKGNGAHNQWMSTVIVNFDLTFPVKAWTEIERYTFVTFCSSQSTMHRIAKFDLDEAYNAYVDPRVVEIMKELATEYNENPTPENYLKLLNTNPNGFKLTARISTNYRCLANIYKQRKDHRLPEWREFCLWIESLPLAKELLI